MCVGEVLERCGREELTVFKFPSNLAYSSRTSCSSGVRLSSPFAEEVCEAERWAGGGESEAMFLGGLCLVHYFPDVVVVGGGVGFMQLYKMVYAAVESCGGVFRSAL